MRIMSGATQGRPPGPQCALVGKRELPVRVTDDKIVVTVPIVESHEVLAVTTG
jgi:hypothetical protein